MNESELFDRLRRTPFEVLFVDIVQTYPLQMGGPIFSADNEGNLVFMPRAKTLIEDNGWNHLEFSEVVRSEIREGHIVTSMQVTSADWQTEYTSRILRFSSTA